MTMEKPQLNSCNPLEIMIHMKLIAYLLHLTLEFVNRYLSASILLQNESYSTRKWCDNISHLHRIETATNPICIIMVGIVYNGQTCAQADLNFGRPGRANSEGRRAFRAHPSFSSLPDLSSSSELFETGSQRFRGMRRFKMHVETLSLRKDAEQIATLRSALYI